jgi:uncharacterized protein (DUF433 family)
MAGVLELTDRIDALQQTVLHLEQRLQRIEERDPGKLRTDRPSIVRVQGVCGGRPIIEGTRISVKTVVGWTRMGMNAQEIIEQNPLIEAAQVADALAYYQDHPEEIDAEFAKEQRYLEQEIPRLQRLVTDRSSQAP